MFWFGIGFVGTLAFIIGWRLVVDSIRVVEKQIDDQVEATTPEVETKTVVRFLTIYSRDTNQCVVENQPYTVEKMDDAGNFTWTTLPSGEIKLEPRDGNWIIIRRESDAVEVSN